SLAATGISGHSGPPGYEARSRFVETAAGRRIRTAIRTACREGRARGRAGPMVVGSPARGALDSPRGHALIAPVAQRDLSCVLRSGVRGRGPPRRRHVPGAVAIEDLLGDLALLVVLGVHREQDVSFTHLALVDLRLVLGNPVADERAGHSPDRRAR